MQPNRAKCALCGDIVESFFSYNEGVCKCGEVHVLGGDAQAFKTSSGNWNNLIYVDDIGNKICIENKDSGEKNPQQKSAGDSPSETLFEGRSKKELIDELQEMIKSDAKLPDNAHIQSLNYVDLLRYMVVILDILKRGA